MSEKPTTLADVFTSTRYVEEMAAWAATDEPSSHLMDAIADLGAEVMAAEDLDYLDAQELAAALAHWNLLDEHDLDAANDIAEAIEEIEGGTDY